MFRNIISSLVGIAMSSVMAIVMCDTEAASATTRSTMIRPQIQGTQGRPYTFRFTVRSYTIGGRTLNIWIGPAVCGGNYGGYGLSNGIGGLLWYTIYGYGCNAGDVVSFSPTSTAVAYPLTGLLSTPTSITESADLSHMWFLTQLGTDSLGSITSTGGITPYPVTGHPATSGIVSGPDRRLWFGAGFGFIDAITMSGAVSPYKLPSTSDNVAAVADGPDGYIWYANIGNGGTPNGVGKISTTGVATDYPIGFATGSIVTGADGNMWFTARGISEVGFVTTSGHGPTTFNKGISGTPIDIVTGPDGNEYFDETVPGTALSSVARITPKGVVTEYALPYGFSPSALAIGPDKNVWVLDANHDQLGQLVLPKTKT